MVEIVEAGQRTQVLIAGVEERIELERTTDTQELTYLVYRDGEVAGRIVGKCGLWQCIDRSGSLEPSQGGTKEEAILNTLNRY